MSGPCQRRDGVDYKANVLYIARFFEAMPQGCHVRIIAPYGGPIGPKLRCSCPPGDDAQALQVVGHLAPRSQGEVVSGLSGSRKLSSFRRKINLHTALPSLGSASGGVAAPMRSTMLSAETCSGGGRFRRGPRPRSAREQGGIGEPVQCLPRFRPSATGPPLQDLATQKSSS